MITWLAFTVLSTDVTSKLALQPDAKSLTGVLTISFLRHRRGVAAVLADTTAPKLYTHTHTVATMSDSLPPAAAAVFATSELLEIVLSNLTMPDVRLYSRVCSAWRDFISGSIKMQRIFFLAPSSSGEALTYIPAEHRISSTAAPSETAQLIVTVNPILDVDFLVNLGSGEGLVFMPTFASLKEADPRMLLTQPPVKKAKMTILMDTSGINIPMVFNENLHDDAGLTVHSVVDGMTRRGMDRRPSEPCDLTIREVVRFSDRRIEKAQEHERAVAWKLLQAHRARSQQGGGGEAASK